MTAAPVLREVGVMADLVTFARLEVEAHDLEPWAEMIGALDLEPEERLWLISLYNTYDDLGSAVSVFLRWPGGPLEWASARDGEDANDYNCTSERRNLRGGRVTKRLASYAGLVQAHGSQEAWLNQAPPVAPNLSPFGCMTQHLRQVWGVGRQSAFEWAEFLAKAAGWDLVASDAQLWESEGPRRSLQSLYGNDKPSAEWLDAAAVSARKHLAERGVNLSWEDFETVICDFHVMRKGRYYPGRHLAALREEIAGVPNPLMRLVLAEAFARVIPDPWARISPGIDPEKMSVYARTGRIIDQP